MSGTSLRPFGSRRFGGGPFDLVRQMQQEIDRVFGDFGFAGTQQQERGRALVPPAEVIEDNESYRIALDLPGIDPQQVEVNLGGHTLTVQAERRSTIEHQGQQEQGQQQQGQQRQVVWTEVTHGQVRRSFEFPTEVDPNRAQADFRNGVLQITLPKSAQARDQQRRIEVKSTP